MPNQNLYRVLNVPQTASADELKKAINRELRLWTNRTNSPEAERREQAERMVELLDQAEAILLDPAQRATYDRQLMSASTPQREVEEGDKRESFSLVRIPDVSSHSMGVVALDENKKEINSIVLSKGTRLPCMMSYTILFGTIVA